MVAATTPPGIWMEPRSTRWAVWTRRAAAALCLVLGLLALIGAAAGLPALRSLVPGWPQMAVSTALCFILAAAALLLGDEAPGPWGERRRRLAMACGTLIAGIAGAALGCYAGLWPLSLDGPLPAIGDRSAAVARMSPATALDLLILGSAAALLQRPSLVVPAQLLALVGMWVGWMGTSRYLFGGEAVALIFAIALTTASALLALGAGLLCARPRAGCMHLLTAPSQGGLLARRLLPWTFILPILLGWLCLLGEQAGWYGVEAGLSLLAVANVVVFALVVWVNADLLHRADRQRRILESQTLHLAAVVASSGDAIISRTPDGLVASWNAGAARLFGYEEAAAIGQPLAVLIPPEDPADEAELERILAEGGQGRTWETVRRDRDGLPRPVSVTVSAIRDPEGRLGGLSYILRDIRERRLADARLHAQLARLDLLSQVTRAISEHHDLPSIYQVVVRCLEEQMGIDFACVCLYDPNANTLTVSRIGMRSEPLALELALGERSVVAVDRNGLSRCLRGELVYEPQIAGSPHPFPARLAAAGLGCFVAAPLTVESLVTGAIIAARRPAHAFASGECEFLRQLSDHVALATRHAELYTALQRAYDDLRLTHQSVLQHERLRALGQMASGIAHDINNALTPIILYSERLLEKEPQLGERTRNTLQTILRAGEDIAATVSRLREFYRQQDRQEQLIGIDLGALVGQVVELTRARWRDLAQARGITIDMRCELAPDLPFVAGVESELREALTNLVLNAVDAMPQGGPITLRARCLETATAQDGSPGGRVVRLEVQDAGCGMDEQVRLRCLEPFFTTKGERGTGLGLAMVYGIVQRHGAELAIDSTPGIGTTVRIDFHILSASPKPPSQAILRLPSRLRLLLVDDDPIILKALSDGLAEDGHELVLAGGGQQGIDAFASAHAAGGGFDVVITDLGMPNVDGRRVAAAIKAISATTPVLMLTGWGQRLNEDDGPPAHVDRVLSKPPKMREVRAALRHLVGDR